MISSYKFVFVIITALNDVADKRRSVLCYAYSCNCLLYTSDAADD